MSRLPVFRVLQLLIHLGTAFAGAMAVFTLYQASDFWFACRSRNQYCDLVPVALTEIIAGGYGAVGAAICLILIVRNACTRRARPSSSYWLGISFDLIFFLGGAGADTAAGIWSEMRYGSQIPDPFGAKHWYGLALLIATGVGAVSHMIALVMRCVAHSYEEEEEEYYDADAERDRHNAASPYSEPKSPSPRPEYARRYDVPLLNASRPGPNAALSGPLYAHATRIVGPLAEAPTGAQHMPQTAVVMHADDPAHWFFLQSAAPMGLQDQNTVPWHDARPFTAVAAFFPRSDDEIEVVVNDSLGVQAIWRDGWAEAQNLRTGAYGMVPLDCLYLGGPAGQQGGPISRRVESQSAGLQSRRVQGNRSYRVGAGYT